MLDAEAAKKRMDQALDRLKAAAERKKDRIENDVKLKSKIGAMKKEQDRLTKALLEVRNQNDSLQYLTKTVADRLDATIRQLKFTLER